MILTVQQAPWFLRCLPAVAVSPYMPICKQQDTESSQCEGGIQVGEKPGRKVLQAALKSSVFWSVSPLEAAWSQSVQVAV